MFCTSHGNSKVIFQQVSLDEFARYPSPNLDLIWPGGVISGLPGSRMFDLFPCLLVAETKRNCMVPCSVHLPHWNDWLVVICHIDSPSSYVIQHNNRLLCGMPHALTPSLQRTSEVPPLQAVRPRRKPRLKSVGSMRVCPNGSCLSQLPMRPGELAARRRKDSLKTWARESPKLQATRGRQPGSGSGCRWPSCAETRSPFYRHYQGSR